MSERRPCLCGCAFDDHAVQHFSDSKPPMYYCRNCCGKSGKPAFWCIEYIEIGNLAWLELKSKEDEKQQTL